MRGNEFLDKMELIDPAYVEAADRKPARRKNAWIKWVAAAACLCIVFGAVTMLSRTDEAPGNLLPCKAVSETPPCRIGSASIQASFAKGYTFESAFAEADAVARIKVKGWIAEDTDIYETYYEATVLQCFKGDIPDTFTLLQAGCSTGTLKRYPLFTGGNELLVFLNEATDTPYESSYWIIGAYLTLLDVSYDENGNRYYIDRYSILGDSIDISTNYALQEDISSQVYSRAVKDDPIVNDMQYSYPYIFSESDMINLIEAQ